MQTGNDITPIGPLYLSDNDKYYSAVYASEKVYEQIMNTTARATCNYIETTVGSGTVLLNVLNMVANNKCKNHLKLNVIINDPNSYVIELYRTLLDCSMTVESIIDSLKVLCKRFNSCKTVEDKEKYLKQLCASLNTIDERSPVNIRRMKGLMYIFVMYFTRTHKPMYNKNGVIVNSFVRLRSVEAESILNIDSVRTLRVITDNSLQKKCNIKITFELMSKNVKDCITSTVPTSNLTHTVVYMNPPYIDTVRRYNVPNETAIGEHLWCIMYLTEYYAKIKRKIPSVILINDSFLYPKRLKYKLVVKYKRSRKSAAGTKMYKQFIAETTRKEDVIFSNKSLGKQKLITCVV